jgi:hypothetical protein
LVAPLCSQRDSPNKITSHSSVVKMPRPASGRGPVEFVRGVGLDVQARGDYCKAFRQNEVPHIPFL